MNLMSLINKHIANPSLFLSVFSLTDENIDNTMGRFRARCYFKKDANNQDKESQRNFVVKSLMVELNRYSLFGNKTDKSMGGFYYYYPQKKPSQCIKTKSYIKIDKVQEKDITPENYDGQITEISFYATVSFGNISENCDVFYLDNLQ